MSSRYDHRRRGEWERDERDRDRDRPGYRGGRRSRSRSPPRRGERDRRAPGDRRDPYGRDREDDRRDRRDDRRRDDRDRRDHDRDGRHEAPPPPRGAADREHDRHDRDRDGRPADRASELDSKHSTRGQRDLQQSSTGTPDREPSGSHPRQDSEVPAGGAEEGEAMDATNDDDAAMMAMMGLTGFGTTKGKHVEGNQEGAVDVKKMRTWRQYMNRRGGFNRPLDKIK
ncbi:hypothetical protein C8Q76DRAFT_786104 [Earliella scabrosa]|nr:hypothetical protein C8Q76DRAFT_786104 [Earliella scabrosa]